MLSDIIKTKNSMLRDLTRRKLYDEHEAARKLYKSIAHNISLPISIRNHFQHKLAQLPRSSSLVRVRNRCKMTGRGRATYKIFGLSRIVIRELASRGRLSDIYKASW